MGFIIRGVIWDIPTLMGFIIGEFIWDIPILIVAYVLFWGPMESPNSKSFAKLWPVLSPKGS